MDSLFIKACRGSPVDRVPIWIMRQAGRYLPEYMEVKGRYDFATMCRTPELATEVTLQPLRRFGLDAAILFSDIMTPLESMGVDIEFAPGPKIADPVRTAADVDGLCVPDAGEIAPFVAEAVRMIRGELDGDTPLIGFAGAPVTLAAYLIEGGGSNDHNRLRSFLWADPAAADDLLDKLSTVMGRYLREQVEAGAQAVQLFDSWAGVLPETLFRRFALPAVKKVFSHLDGLDIPRIYFAHGAAAFWPAVSESGVDVLGVDWRIPLDAARTLAGRPVTLQGNLDPAVLRAPRDTVVSEALKVLDLGGGRRHVFNLGHGILPDIPVDNVYALVDTVKNYQIPAS